MTTVAGPRRRSGNIDPTFGLNYTAIGATATDEVLAFPPAGFRPAQSHHRIGSGTRRFDIAGRRLMTWGVLSAAGITVQDVRAETSHTTGTELRGGLETGPLYLQDGTQWITPGMTATLVIAEKPLVVRAPIKVLWVIDEPGRIGFAYGSCPGHPAQIEQLLLLEHASDDSVWFTTRSISKASGHGASAAVWRMRQKHYDRKFLTALHPTHTAA